MRQLRSNQREFYRVGCPVLLSHRALGAGVPRGVAPDSHFPDAGHFGLLRELRRMDYDHGHLLHAIGERDRELGAYLAHLNRKFDTLARHLVSLDPETVDAGEQEVSLSEGGMGFHLDEPPPPGTVLAIRLTLLPSWIGLTLYGTVVAAAAGERNVSVRFEHLQDADRQILARHVMQVQMSRQRRSRGHPADHPGRE